MQFLINIFKTFFTSVHSLVASGITDPNFSYGIAIILFTAIIRILLLPLTIKQTKSSIAMQKVQPMIKEVQDKYKNDPQKAQAEVMRIYKEHNANPLSGCLPLLIQFPLLTALFYTFNNLSQINGVSFLWIPDLSQPDKTFILVILSVLTTYIQGRMTTMGMDSAQAKQSSTMNVTMSIMFGFFSYKAKSALVLYWVTQNLFSMGQTFVMQRMGLRNKPVDAADTKVETVKVTPEKNAKNKINSNKNSK